MDEPTDLLLEGSWPINMEEENMDQDHEYQTIKNMRKKRARGLEDLSSPPTSNPSSTQKKTIKKANILEEGINHLHETQQSDTPLHKDQPRPHIQTRWQYDITLTSDVPNPFKEFV